MIDIKELRDISKNFSVLYVEDDELLRTSMGIYLAKFFSKVVSAADGIDGLKKYDEQPFDILITDISMPNMNGLEMISKIKSKNENQLILITTAHTEADYMFKCIKLGIDGYVIKPFDNEQLNSELFKIVKKLNILVQNTCATCTTKSFDLQQSKISSISEIEFIG